MSFLTRMFPKKVKTLMEFVRFAQQGKILSISITPMLDRNYGTSLLHEAKINKGRRIVYHEIITHRDGDLATRLAFAVVPEAVHTEILKLCLTGEKRVKELQSKFPGITVSLTAGKAEPWFLTNYIKRQKR